MSKYNQGLFYDRVPKLVQLLLIILLSVILFGITPIYTTNIPYLVSGTGAMTEYYIWANYASVIGMGAAMPLIIRLKARFRTKEIFVSTFVGMAMLFIVMGTTKQPEVIVGASLLLGFLRMLAMMEVILPLFAILSADGNRGRFYTVFYTSVLIMTQISGYHVTEISHHFNWQYAYLYIAAICLGSALICVIFQHNLRFMKKIPLYYVDWYSGLLSIISFMILGYVFSFGKQQAWFASDNIKWATVAFFALFSIFLIRQQVIKRPFITLTGFRKSNVIHGMLMLGFLGMFLATATLQNTFAMGILRYNPMVNASLNLLMIPGLIVGAWVSIKWFAKEIPVKMLIFSGFASFMMYCIILYFSMVPEFGFSSWVLPMFFRGYGMGVLFIAIWFYTFDKLGLTEMLAAIGLVLIWRMFITLGGFTALFSWIQYQLQLQSLGNLAVYIDDVLLFSPGRGGIDLIGVQINGVLAANKTLFGYIIIAGIGVLTYVLTHHFGRPRFNLLNIKVSRKGELQVSDNEHSYVLKNDDGEIEETAAKSE